MTGGKHMKKKARSGAEDVRIELSKIIKREPDPAIWEYLVNESYVGEVIDGFSDAMKNLVDTYHKLENLKAKTSVPKKIVKEIPPDQRGVALSKILAVEAAEEPDVIKFREQFLGGKTLTWDEAISWIEEQHRKDGRPTKWVSLPIPKNIDICVSDITLNWLNEITKTSPKERRLWSVSYEVKLLEYVLPESPWVQHIPIAMNGTLDHLRLVSERLAKKYKWQPAAATIFILAGVLYVMPKARITTKTNMYYPALSSISIELLPSVPVNEISKLYANARKKLLGPGRRDPAITQKWRAELAVFVAEHNDGRSWRDVMELWNKKHPVSPSGERRAGQAYENPSTFARDGRQAYEKITGKRLMWGKDKSHANHEGFARQLKNIFSDEGVDE
jgi:hypothetical protein